eukprot:Blabericola_migrator_1__3560@NODE_2057_length_3351_cov_142_635810_g1304_i0_p3_GENE_NODE_2057_length_3351_cov_142_635810_g1304_i0NODE_2057_length_3351_cov_142_635810_g1304_i0_p3_ORF_typecomplete_len159_score5_57NT5C/PF06941_12/1_5e20HAD_2/PF13419_6/3_5e05NIF/PF03031_18/0_059_NODE_2057_length_3351_cov_142_635810_g1304_i020112487
MINSFETQTTALPVFALDIDEVLADTLTQCNAWHNEVFGTSYTIDDYKSYRFCETWGCTDDEAMTRFLAFTKSPYWDRIEPIPGSQEFVRQMQLYYRLAIVTSRQNYLKAPIEGTKRQIFRQLMLYFGEAHRPSIVLLLPRSCYDNGMPVTTNALRTD